LLLAMAGDEPAGCVALKRLAGDVCEMKRLYVRPGHRGSGLGRRLVEDLVQQARARGYRAIRLDTVPSLMGAAVAMYRSLGFRDIPAYCFNPIAGALYMELPLQVSGRAKDAIREVNN
jgi:ribosomal protein S18 acetylase RimI-like enzyme